MATWYANEARRSGFQADPKWSIADLPPMTQQRQVHAAVKVNDHRILVIGGHTDKGYLATTTMYDSLTSWQNNWPSLHEKRGCHAAALCDNKVYVFGGWNGKTVYDSIECLDLSSAKKIKWKTLYTRLSCKRAGCAAAVVGTEIYIMGGFNGTCRVASVDILDTTTDTIRPGPSLQTARSGCAAGVVGDDTIYVVGGKNLEGNLDTIEFLHTNTNTPAWQTCNVTMSTARGYPAVAVVRDCLVIMGGEQNNQEDDNNKYLSSVEVVDTRRNVGWRLPDMNKRRNASAAVTLNESQVVVMGGYDNGAWHASVETLTLVTPQDTDDSKSTVQELSIRLTQSELTRKNELQALEAKHAQELQALEQKHTGALEALERKRQQELDASERKRKQDYDAMQKELKRQKTESSKATEWGCSIS